MKNIKDKVRREVCSEVVKGTWIEVHSEVHSEVVREVVREVWSKVWDKVTERTRL